MKRLKLFFFILAGLLTGCNYLDVVPDNIATIDYAFRSRVAAERYLYTCYSYMPDDASINASPSLVTGDEFWLYPTWVSGANNIAKGLQNKVTPQVNYWAGNSSGKPMFQALRDCNIFLENIGKVPDLDSYQRDNWTGEVIFLKAYYHYFLFRLYGPIPLIKANQPITASTEEAKVKRMPVDSCISYIVQLLDEAAELVPDQVMDRNAELGRITKSIVMALKADVLVTAASPLYNGNPDYASFKDKDGVLLFNPVYAPEKWDSALVACQEAVSVAEEAGHKLYEFTPGNTQYKVSPVTRVHMSIRNAVVERWNDEIIWANSNSLSVNTQRFSFIRALDPIALQLPTQLGILAPPIKIVEQFYTRNGVPINEDKTWDYQNRYGLREANEEDKYLIKNGYLTAKLNFDREPRFYADLAFDGAVWYGHGKFDDEDPWYAEMKLGQTGGFVKDISYTVTGYLPKKLTHFENVATATALPIKPYPWPLIRLADLYLLYAEALNEVNGPAQQTYEYINKVRTRAGLASVEESWTTYSTNPTKFTTKTGLRDIIHQERLIELVFEGKRFYDLRRWKKAMQVLNNPVEGWSVKEPETVPYYQKRPIFYQTFTLRDYFWPIRESDIIVNRNLVQNPGW